MRVQIKDLLGIQYYALYYNNNFKQKQNEAKATKKILACKSNKPAKIVMITRMLFGRDVCKIPVESYRKKEVHRRYIRSSVVLAVMLAVAQHKYNFKL